MAAARPRITPPSVSATWWRTRSVWSRNACSGWSPSDARAAVGHGAELGVGGGGGPGQAGEQPPEARTCGVRRGPSRRPSAPRGPRPPRPGWRGRGTAGRAASATRGPMTLPPGSERRRERDDRCHWRQSATRWAPLAARDSPTMGLRSWFLRAESGRTRVMTAAAIGAVAAFVVGVVRALAAHRAGRLGRHRRARWSAPSGSSIGASPPSRRSEFAVKEDDTRASTHLLLARRRAGEPGRGGARVPEGQRGHAPPRGAARGVRGGHDRVLVAARAHGVRAAVRARVLHGARRAASTSRRRATSTPTTSTSPTPRSPSGMTFQVSDTDITRRDDAPPGAAARAHLVPLRRRDPGDHVNVIASLLNT